MFAPNRVTRIAGLAIAGLIAAGCSSATEAAVAVEESTAAPSTTATPTTAAPTTTAPTTTTTAAPAPPDLTGLIPISYPAMGGLRFGVAGDVEPYSEGDMILLSRPGVPGQVVIARVSASGGDTPIETIDQLRAQAADFVGAESEPNGEELEFLGETLEGYRFELAPGTSLSPGPGLFPGRPFGVGGNSSWTPAPLADVFLGEIDTGVLAVGVIAGDEEGLAAGHALLDDVLPTVHLLTPDGAPNPLPTAFYGVVGEAAEYEQVVADNEGPPELIELFSPLAPGQYQITNLATHIEMDVPDGWFVVPNFPGFVVLSDISVPGIIGPNRSDVIFQQQANALSAVGSGLEPDGDPVPIDEIDAFLADPPRNLLVSNVDKEATIGGVQATRFDLRVDPTATCQPGDPCSFLITSPEPNLVKDVKGGAISRIWWIDDTPGGALAISMATAEMDSQWLDGRGQEFIDGLVITP